MELSQPVEPVREWPPARVLPLEGGRNFRDLGGYATEDGRRVRWGLLFRSGSLTGLTRADWSHLGSRGVRALCDLRSTSERRSEPFLPADLPAVNYWARDYTTSFAELRGMLRGNFATGESARQAMITGYRGLPFEQAVSYRQLFAHLKAADIPLIFNCSAGKDRTGTAAALILRALGVPRETVMEDFVLTNTVLNLQSILLKHPGSSLAKQPAEVVTAITSADPAYIQAALDSIDERHEDIAGFLRAQLDVNEAELQRIKEALLE
jgi:protein-tyrosine phosphatase